MQELLLVTNRRNRLRVTAWGGAVAGLLIGVGICSAIGFMLYDRQQANARVREATMKAGYEARLTAAGEELRSKERAFSGSPISYLAQAQEAKSLQLQNMLSQFPAFKSDVYKELFTNLSDEIGRQAKEAQSLRNVLTSADTVQAARCAIAPKGVVSPSLWSNGTVSFHKDGWRGVTP